MQGRTPVYVIAGLCCGFLFLIVRTGPRNTALLDPFDAEGAFLQRQKSCRAVLESCLSQSNLPRECALCRLALKLGRLQEAAQKSRGIHQSLNELSSEPRELIGDDVVPVDAREGRASVSVSGSQDRLMGADELPAHTLKLGIMDYCMSRFPVRILLALGSPHSKLCD